MKLVDLLRGVLISPPAVHEDVRETVRETQHQVESPSSTADGAPEGRGGVIRVTRRWRAPRC